MARLGGFVRAISGRLAARQQTGVALLGRYIAAHGPSMARLLNTARAIFGSLIFLNEKACFLKNV